MRNKLINKTIIYLFCLFTAITLPSCSDWNDVEPLDVVNPNIEDQNPELYAKYLENLRQYKVSNHKITYAWFDNSEKVPFNRAQHIDNIPDSIDVVALLYPDQLVERELSEMDALRKNKNTTFIFTLNYEAIKLRYDNMQAEKEAGDDNESESFIHYLADTLQYTLKLVDKYNYDGISVAYNGKSTQHLTPEEKEEYIANESAFTDSIISWANKHKNKTLVFEGKPQNLVNKTLLNSCKHIIIPCNDATNGSKVIYNLLAANQEGVPSDRFIVTAQSASLDPTDSKTGYWSDNSRSVVSTAQLVASSLSNISIAGLGIYNINNDYYNTYLVYQYTRNAIGIMNPSLKN